MKLEQLAEVPSCCPIKQQLGLSTNSENKLATERTRSAMLAETLQAPLRSRASIIMTRSK